MCYRYLALIDDDRMELNSMQELHAALNRLGMRERGSAGPLRLFSTEETPALSVPGGGLLIGHLFRREDGSSALDSERTMALRSPTHARKHILDNCWGDYVLMQPIEDEARGFTIVRDPSGGLPCIYLIRGHTGFITSDISLATTVGLYSKRVDWDFVSSCLVYPQQKTGRTGLIDVHELLPGCCLSVRSARASTNLLWSPWNYVASENRSRDLAEARIDIRRNISLAVKALAETDRSILLQLSGGLDSSIVGICLRDTKASVKCGTMVTPVPGADERQYASLVAEALDTELHTTELRFEDARFDFVPPAHLASPSIMALQYAIDVALDALGNHLGVASYFSGAGGDSVFCYLKTAAPAADAFRERGFALSRSSVHDLAQLHQCTLWKVGRLTLRKLLRTPSPPRKADHTFIVSSKITHGLETHPWFDAPTDALPGDRERVFDLACSHAFRDGSPRGVNRRMRMPLLSQPVMEACLRAPSWMWFDGGRNRALARSAFAELLPRKILDRGSKGTFVNYTAAVYRRNRESLRDFLLTGHLQSRGLLDADALKRFFQSELRPRDQSFMRIFDLAMIENWVRHQP